MILSPSNSKTGFTLIEIMLALLVITIGMVSLIGVLSSSVETSSKSRSDIYAVTFADLVLNYCHAEGYDAISGTGSLPFINESGSSSSLTLDSISTYTIDLPGIGTSAPQEFTISYRLQITEATDIKTLHLEIWPGRDTTSVRPRHFYTELYNWKRTP